MKTNSETKHSVKVTIERKANKIIVSNSYGATWEFETKAFHSDASLNGCIADIAGAMLTSTIVSHLVHLSNPKIAYTLTVEK